MIQGITVNTVGRLGNNMFQIAAAASLANELGTHFFLPTYDAAPGTFPNLEYTYRTLVTQKIWNAPVRRYTEESFEYKPIKLSKRIDGIVELDGYFQSPRYFNEELVRMLFKFDFKHDKVDDSKYQDYVSVHVRRGDYLGLQDCHPVQGLDYYKRAMSLFPTDTRFLVFSDDIEWCVANLVGGNIEYFRPLYGGPKEFDMYIMSLCGGHIIANSTFSWWAAWLSGENTVAPKNWFGPKLGHSTKDLIPEGWVEI